jgi:hypothetical protein
VASTISPPEGLQVLYWDALHAVTKILRTNTNHPIDDSSMQELLNNDGCALIAYFSNFFKVPDFFCNSDTFAIRLDGAEAAPVHHYCVQQRYFQG